MILYHGSNVVVREPHLLKIQRELDFGKGFYTTSDLEQAGKWARRTARQRKTGSPFVSVYEVNTEALSELLIRRFAEPNVAWLDYIAANRRGLAPAEDYDVVIGPVADDQTFDTLLLYFAGIFTPEQTIQRLLPQNLKNQYAFKTQQAINLLHFTEVKEV